MKTHMKNQFSFHCRTLYLTASGSVHAVRMLEGCERAGWGKHKRLRNSEATWVILSTHSLGRAVIHVRAFDLIEKRRQEQP